MARTLAALPYHAGIIRNLANYHALYQEFLNGHAGFDFLHRRGVGPGRRVRVAFLGLWDCTGNVSFWPTAFPNEMLNPTIDCIRHAVARDDRRAENVPTLYQTAPPMPFPETSMPFKYVKNQDIYVLEYDCLMPNGEICLKRRSSVPDLGIKEVVFPGDHTTITHDCGTPFSDAPALWMAREFQRRFPESQINLSSLSRESPDAKGDDGSDEILSGVSLLHRSVKHLAHLFNECIPRIWLTATPEGKVKRKLLFHFGRERSIQDLEEWEDPQTMTLR